MFEGSRTSSERPAYLGCLERRKSRMEVLSGLKKRLQKAFWEPLEIWGGNLCLSLCRGL